MFSRIATVGIITAGVGLHLSRRKATCSAANEGPHSAGYHPYPFDSRGIPNFIPTNHIIPNSATSPIYLVGVGMRRKFLIIAEFDVYLVGVGLSKPSLQAAAEWGNAPEDQRKPLSSYILPKPVSNSPKKSPGNPPSNKTVVAAVMIHMVRAATRAQFVDAFRAAFEGVDQKHFQDFQPLLESCMGEKGMAAKDEMGFYFLNDGTLMLAKNGEYKGSLSIPEINERLLDIYSDPKRAVSKELTTSISHNFKKVQEQFAQGK